MKPTASVVAITVMLTACADTRPAGWEVRYQVPPARDQLVSQVRVVCGSDYAVTAEVEVAGYDHHSLTWTYRCAGRPAGTASVAETFSPPWP